MGSIAAAKPDAPVPNNNSPRTVPRANAKTKAAPLIGLPDGSTRVKAANERPHGKRKRNHC